MSDEETPTHANDAYARFAKAKEEMGALVKDADNTYFHSSYATLAQCHAVALPALRANGLDWLETTHINGDTIELHAGVVDAKTGAMVSGDSWRDGAGCAGKIPLVCKEPNNPQALGSAITYGRRYLICTLCGLCPVDDDGNAASHSEPRSPAPQQSSDGGLRAHAVDLWNRVKEAHGLDAANAAIEGCSDYQQRINALNKILKDKE